MCGIVGLFLKDPKLEPDLGRLLSQMMGVLSDRGPDSAGFAVFGRGETGNVKLTVRGAEGTDFLALARRLSESLGVRIAAVGRHTHGILTLPADRETDAKAALAKLAPEIDLVGAGTRMELYKEVGRPELVATQFGLERMLGTHGICHTRMATESAITTNGAHPFSTGLDQCLVHNGSLSNHNAVRRELRREGIEFATENDTEVAAGYLTARMHKGASLKQALTDALTDLDGFYTFVVGTESGFGVLRDPIACKPAVMAETDRYVAFGSEYRALVDLPDIAKARIWEPEPSTVYFWERPN